VKYINISFVGTLSLILFFYSFSLFNPDHTKNKRKKEYIWSGLQRKDVKKKREWISGPGLEVTA
jgi:hypothetical protein